MTGEVTSIADYLDDNRRIDVATSLELLAADIRAGNGGYQVKRAVICLCGETDDGTSSTVEVRLVNVDTEQALGMAELIKIRILRVLGLLP